MYFEDPALIDMVREWERTERGSLPSYVESCIMVWQAGSSTNAHYEFKNKTFSFSSCVLKSPFTFSFTLLKLKDLISNWERVLIGVKDGI